MSCHNRHNTHTCSYLCQEYSLFCRSFATASFPDLQGTNSVICTIYVQYLYNICTFTNCTYIVQLLYIYCTTTSVDSGAQASLPAPFPFLFWWRVMGNAEVWVCVNVGVNEDGERDNDIKHKIVFGELLRSATRISLLRFDSATHHSL